MTTASATQIAVRPPEMPGLEEILMERSDPHNNYNALIETAYGLIEAESRPAAWAQPLMVFSHVTKDLMTASH